MTNEQFLGLLFPIGVFTLLIVLAIHEAADKICDQIEKAVKRND